MTPDPCNNARMNDLSDETPVLVDLKPVGSGYMEDFHTAGGLEAVLRGIKSKLRIDPHFPSIVDIQCGEKAILL